MDVKNFAAPLTVGLTISLQLAAAGQVEISGVRNVDDLKGTTVSFRLPSGPASDYMKVEGSQASFNNQTDTLFLTSETTVAHKYHIHPKQSHCKIEFKSAWPAGTKFSLDRSLKITDVNAGLDDLKGGAGATIYLAVNDPYVKAIYCHLPSKTGVIQITELSSFLKNLTVTKDETTAVFEKAGRLDAAIAALGDKSNNGESPSILSSDPKKSLRDIDSGRFINDCLEPGVSSQRAI